MHSLSLLMAGGVIGAAAGVAFVLWINHRRRTDRHSRQDAGLRDLLDILRAMDEALQEVSLDALNARGEWDRAQFDDVLRRVEALTPEFQAVLADVLSRDGRLDNARVTALLAVDRLSAAYTYWTRLFPPRQSNEAMFVLSLLHDLGEKVATAIERVERQP